MYSPRGQGYCGSCGAWGTMKGDYDMPAGQWDDRRWYQGKGGQVGSPRMGRGYQAQEQDDFDQDGYDNRGMMYKADPEEKEGGSPRRKRSPRKYPRTFPRRPRGSPRLSPEDLRELRRQVALDNIAQGKVRRNRINQFAAVDQPDDEAKMALEERRRTDCHDNMGRWLSLAECRRQGKIE